ncbi:MAG: PQQ-binding-like beta-propeller repeat protein [Acidobacteria bacterium]|nr:PQQ-binding-like beta-propeller repeat protein [Acidobacteriota bacterium]
MSRRLSLIAAGLVLVAVGTIWRTFSVAGQAELFPSTADGEWPHYAADQWSTRYSPLDQIDASNFNDLEVAWTFKTDNLGASPEFKLEGTPLMVGGVLYTTAGTRRAAVALDARTGELIWMHSLREGRRGGLAPRQLSGRGVAYWTDGRGDDRVLYVTPGYRLIALDAATGDPIPTFGDGGIVDLKVGVVYGRDQPIDLVTGEIGIHSTPLIARDKVIVGSAMKEGLTVETHNNTKGLVRAFDVRTGELEWTFHTIPRPGEFGNETWLNESWAVNGNVGVWTQMSADEELGLVYLPVETPTSDLYGGHRPGENLFAESLVAVDLDTGLRRWHFQMVHHPIWNFDACCAPILADIVVDGRPIKAVAMPSKQAYLYVFDRATGEPVWPIEELPVPRGDVPGEWYSPTQPVPTRPPAYARNFLDVPGDLIDFTPDLRAEALTTLERYVWHPTPFNPPIIGNVDGPYYGAITGGTASNWPGGGYDPLTGTVYLPAGNSPGAPYSIAPGPEGFSDIRYLSGVVGAQFQVQYAAGTGQNPDVSGPEAELQGSRTRVIEMPRATRRRPTTEVQGLPIVKPPYGILAAVDLNRGEIKFQVPHGDTPSHIRNHPLLRDMDIPKTGQGRTGYIGLMVTRTLVVMGDPLVTIAPGRSRGAMLRAYNKESGEEVGAVWMPAEESGSPMTYMVDGKQYIVVAIGGGTYTSEYRAFALPD